VHKNTQQLAAVRVPACANNIYTFGLALQLWRGHRKIWRGPGDPVKYIGDGRGVAQEQDNARLHPPESRGLPYQARHVSGKSAGKTFHSCVFGEGEGWQVAFTDLLLPQSRCRCVLVRRRLGD